MDETTGETRGDLTVSRFGRLARRRRARHGIAAASTAATCCAAVTVLAVGLAAPNLGHSSPERLLSSQNAAGVPRYYIQHLTSSTATQTLVRETATGAVTATVRCPWAGAYMSGLAPADGGTFFLACQRTSESASHLGSRLYRFRLTKTGTIPGYRLVPGGVLPGLSTTGLTAAADGSEIAMKTSTIRPASKATDLLVISTSTGAHAFWSAPQSGGRYWDYALSPHGQYLRFLRTRTNTLVDDVIGQVPASRGGLLSSARVLVHVNLWPTHFTYARISPGGSVLTVVGYQLNLPKGTGTMIVDQMAVPSGKVIRTLFRTTFALEPRAADGKRLPLTGWDAYASSDPSGRYIIVTYGPILAEFNGWIVDGPPGIPRPGASNTTEPPAADLALPQLRDLVADSAGAP